MVSLDPKQQVQGTSYRNLIVLADVRLDDGDYSEITAKGFGLALRVMYPECVSRVLSIHAMQNFIIGLIGCSSRFQQRLLWNGA